MVLITSSFKGVQPLTVSPLEISVIAFIACSIIICTLDWKKPQGVEVPFTLLFYEKGILAEVLEIIKPLNYTGAHNWLNTKENVP